jgi:hypothetical protein
MKVARQQRKHSDLQDQCQHQQFPGAKPEGHAACKCVLQARSQAHRHARGNPARRRANIETKLCYPRLVRSVPRHIAPAAQRFYVRLHGGGKPGQREPTNTPMAKNVAENSNPAPPTVEPAAKSTPPPPPNSGGQAGGKKIRRLPPKPPSVRREAPAGAVRRQPRKRKAASVQKISSTLAKDEACDLPRTTAPPERPRVIPRQPARGTHRSSGNPSPRRARRNSGRPAASLAALRRFAAGLRTADQLPPTNVAAFALSRCPALPGRMMCVRAAWDPAA